MPKPIGTPASQLPLVPLNVAGVPAIVTLCAANALPIRTGNTTVAGGCVTMYASDATFGASISMQSIFGPFESTIAGKVTLSGTLLSVAEVTLADRSKS